MADAKTTGQDYPIGYAPGYPTPGYGTTLADRMRAYQGQNVQIYVGDELAEVSGMLHYVGANYLEVHRMGVSSTREAVFIPMQYIYSIVAPLQQSPGHHP